MPFSPIDPEAASDDVKRLYERFAEAAGVDALPDAFHTYGRSEPFLKDLFMNAKKFVFGDGQITATQRALIALATAAHSKNAAWTELIRGHLDRLGVGEQSQLDCIAVASTNYMYNTFFKFRTLSGTDRFDALPVALRAHTFAGTSLDDATVELINTAISDLNACKPCVEGHVAKAKKLDLSDEQILEAIQVAATVYAGCMFLNSTSI